MREQLTGLLHENGVKDIPKISEYINKTLEAMTWANVPYYSVSFYVVVRNMQEDLVLKCIDGLIIADRLDSGFLASRDIIGLEAWNTTCVLRVSFSESGGIDLRTVTLEDIKDVVMDVVGITRADYVVTKTGFPTQLVVVDLEAYEDLAYKEWFSCIQSTVDRLFSGNNVIDLNWSLVDYN